MSSLLMRIKNQNLLLVRRDITTIIVDTNETTLDSLQISDHRPAPNYF